MDSEIYSKEIPTAVCGCRDFVVLLLWKKLNSCFSFAGIISLIYLCGENKNINIMATAIRAIPTLYGETARDFESEAMFTEQNPGTEDYSHEAQVVADFLKTCTAL